MKISTNNQPRDVLYWWDLTEKEKDWLDYLDNEDRQNESTFFRYKGHCYDLGEVMRTGNAELSDWDGYCPDSYFSGVVVKYTNDFESVIVGTYFC